MDYHLTITERASYLHAAVSGPNTRENVLRFLKEAYEACVARGKTSALLEMALTGPSLDTSSIFSVIAERSGDGAKLRRIAYVGLSEARDDGKARFAETVAVNRGVNVRFFRDVAEAQKWLARD
jgi:chromosome condensin MukBEF MukE localization factor